MVFLDTCVWIELFAIRTPRRDEEVRQARVATELFSKLIGDKYEIVTCREQLIEIVVAIQKATKRKYNETRGEKKGINDIKEYRELPEFKQTQELCKYVLKEIRTVISKTVEIEFNVEKVLDNIHLADINDCLYYEYCKANQIPLYTFDRDLANFRDSEIIKVI